MDEQKIYEALLNIKEMCSRNFVPIGSCDCPCFVAGDCKLLIGTPRNWELKIRTRTVFFDDAV